MVNRKILIEKMTENDVKQDQNSTEVKTIPPSPYTEARKASIEEAKAHNEEAKALHESEELLPKEKKKKKYSCKTAANFLYDPRRKTVLGRSALNWGKIIIYIY